MYLNKVFQKTCSQSHFVGKWYFTKSREIRIKFKLRRKERERERKRVSVKLELVASGIWSSPLKIKLYRRDASHCVSFIYLDHGGRPREPRAVPGTTSPSPALDDWVQSKGFSQHLTISSQLPQIKIRLQSVSWWLINLVRYQRTSRHWNFIIILYLMDIVTLFRS